MEQLEATGCKHLNLRSESNFVALKPSTDFVCIRVRVTSSYKVVSTIHNIYDNLLKLFAQFSLPECKRGVSSLEMI